MIFVFLIYVAMADKLLQVQILWRHGARTPLHCNWKCDEFMENQQLNGYLTPTGIRQHYVLGQWLRKRYIEDQQFLKNVFDINEIHIECTDVNRTIVSAISNFQGMYPQGTGPLIPEDLDEEYLLPPIDGIVYVDIGDGALPNLQQAVPVHVRQKEYDIYLRGYDIAACPKCKEIREQNLKTELYRKVNSYANELIQSFGNQMNVDPKSLDISELLKYQDTFFSCEFNGYQMPILDKFTQDGLKQLSVLTSALENFQTFDQARLMATPFMRNLINNNDNAIKGRDYFKYHVYSAHDTTVQLMLIALNYSSAECMTEVYLKQKVNNTNCQYIYPGYASNIIFELYERSRNDHYIQILYNGTVLNVCGNQNKCNYTQFKDILQFQEVSNYEEECNPTFKEEEVPTWMIVLMVIMGIILLVVLIIGMTLLAKIKRYEQLQRIPNDQLEV